MQAAMYWIGIRGCVTERTGSALEGVCLETDSAETVFTDEIHDPSECYGLLDRGRDLGLEVVSVPGARHRRTVPTTARD
ncbi:hypothetical protein ACVWWN_000153 [Mycobacterium sp. URHB0021]